MLVVAASAALFAILVVFAAAIAGAILVLGAAWSWDQARTFHYVRDGIAFSVHHLRRDLESIEIADVEQAERQCSPARDDAVARGRLTLAALAAVTLVGVAVIGVWTVRRPMHTRE